MLPHWRRRCLLAYPRFQNLQAEESRPLYDTKLVPVGILPIAEGLVERVKVGIEVADLGCGEGHALNLMAQAFPNSPFVGYDFSAEAINRPGQAERLGLSNARFELRDITDLGLVQGGST